MKKIAEQIRSNINNGAKIWEVNSRTEQKTKYKYQLKNEEGETLRQPDKIKKEHTKYYSTSKNKTSNNIRRTASRNKSGEAI